MEMPIFIIRCPGAPDARRGTLGASAALYARNAVVVEPRRGDLRARWLPGTIGIDVVGIGDDEQEDEMTVSMACAIAASSASALGKWRWPWPGTCRLNGTGCGGRDVWSICAAASSRGDVVVDDDMAAIVLRRSDVEPSAGLPTEMEGSEDDDDDGRVGGSWSSSSSSDCWKNSSENTWPRLA
jgi:hypothetical protein